MAYRPYMWKMSGLIGTALLFALCSSPEALAKTASAGSLSANDIAFMKDAARSGLEEVHLGEMAQRISTNDRIRFHAQRLVQDRTKVNDDLRRLAAKKHISLPKTFSAQQEATNTMLMVRRGKAFDTLYLETTLRDHKDDLAAFQKEAADGSDPDVKNLASLSISVIEEHLRFTEAIAQDSGMPIDPD